MSVKQLTKFDEFLDIVTNKTSSCSHEKKDAFDTCFSNAMVTEILKMDDRKVAVTRYRDLMSDKLREYTCNDLTMNTSTAIRSESYNINNHDYQVDVLFDTPAAKIWTVYDFITDKECSILREHATPFLQGATVSGTNGESIYSEHRKAQQAGYGLHQNNANDPLRSLASRVFQLTNQHTGYNLNQHGQEDLTIIQYNVKDEYKPHCDGSCDGSAYLPKGRVATAIMYCQIPELGGGTSFTKADIFIKPEKGI